VTSNVQRNGTDNATSTLSTAYAPIRFNPKDRRTFIGGSDARIIMGDDEDRLVRLWREKRGEAEPEDLPDEQQRTPVPCQQDRMLCLHNSTVDVKKFATRLIRCRDYLALTITTGPSATHLH
jgi:hypothetical protein